MKKIMILAASFLLTLSAACLFGCGGNGNESTDAGQSSGTESEIPEVSGSEESETPEEASSEDSGSEDSESAEIPHVHELIHYEAREAVCEEEGNVEYWECGCGAYFSDAEGENEIVDKASLVIAAPGHPTEIAYDKEGHWEKATCEHTEYVTEKVSHTFEENVCTVCGALKETEGLEYKLTSDGTGYAVIGLGTATDTSIVIPSAYNELPVTEIGSKAFKDCAAIVSIKLPESLTTIGDSAFYGCEALTEMTIPVNVSKIGSGIFSYCNALESIRVEKGNGDFYAKGNCLIQEGAWHTAGDIIVAGCKNSDIPSGIQFINAKAFYGLSELKSVSFTSGIQYIYAEAFYGCGITAANLANTSIKTVNGSVFSHCKSLTSVKLPTTLQTISSSAFAYCESLTSITLPAEVSTIRSNAFIGCTSLASVTFGTTSGWKAGTTSVSVKDTAKNAKYLTETYVAKEWTRS